MRRFPFVSLLLVGCAFNPDLSRFPPCGDGGQCAPGSSCLTEEQRCVPSCGEQCPGGLALPATPLLPAIETRPYTVAFMPTGGEGAYFFSIDGGVPGFTLSAGGQLSTPAAPTPGVFPFSITVQDEAVPRGQVTTGFNLQVRPLLRVASQGSLVEGRQGQPYAEQLWATGGQAPYHWVVDGGLPPAGLSLLADGGLVGSPSAMVTASFGVWVSDSAIPPQQASRLLSVEVKTADALLAIATRSAAEGRVGTPYSQRLRAYGGTQPYAWSVLTGTLPPGVTLSNTGTMGELSGTPTDAGTFDFTMKCADTLTSQNQALRITVY